MVVVPIAKDYGLVVVERAEIVHELVSEVVVEVGKALPIHSTSTGGSPQQDSLYPVLVEPHSVIELESACSQYLLLGYWGV